jgi:hypothetical protein
MEHLVHARGEQFGGQPFGTLPQPRRRRDTGKATAKLADRPAAEAVEDRRVEPPAARCELRRAGCGREPDAVTGVAQPLRQPSRSRIARLREEQDVHRRA